MTSTCEISDGGIAVALPDMNFTFTILSPTHGSVAVVAPARFRAEIEARKWLVSWNAHRAPGRQLSVAGSRKNPDERSLHRLIWDLSGGKETPQIDHRDGQPLNNAEDNLRAATNTENQRNRRQRKNNTSGAIGVSFCKRTGRWEAYTTVDRKRRFLGRYVNIADAIRARDAAVARLHGEFAVLNRPLAEAASE